MMKSLRRNLFPCCFSTKKPKKPHCLDTQETEHQQKQEQAQEEEEQEQRRTSFFNPQRPSRTMVIGTIFGHRRGNVWFCVQTRRDSPKPILLLELPILTSLLVSHIRSSGLVRFALSAHDPGPDPGPLRSTPLWATFLNGKRLPGLAAKRSATDGVRSVLKTTESITFGAGVIPAASGFEEVMFVRAHYEHVVGNGDSESFHLVNPDESGPNQELGVFLMRSQF